MNKLFLAFAVQCGYQIVEIHEVWAFKEFAKIFKKFYNVLASIKIKASGFPSHVAATEEKLKYCQDINKDMDFCGKPELELTLENVTYNAALRKASKAAQNAIFGNKFVSLATTHHHPSLAFSECEIKKGLLLLQVNLARW